MWKWLAAGLLVSTSAWAQEAGTAYEAIRVIGSRIDRNAINHVISVTGVQGTPQPETWKVMLELPRGEQGAREVEIADGRIKSDRVVERSNMIGSAEGATIKTSRLNLDSSGAYSVAAHTADRSHTEFSTVSYHLRTDEKGEPVWVVTLHQRSGKPVGTIYIGANRGTVTRTEGMFTGLTMDDVTTEQEPTRNDEGGIINNTKARIRDTFQRAQDEARGMFDRVRQSFTDFIERNSP